MSGVRGIFRHCATTNYWLETPHLRQLNITLLSFQGSFEEKTDA